jgi:hypothetical protein
LSRQADRSSWISIRHTVGGAQKLVTSHRSSTSSSAGAANRVKLKISTQAPAFHGANTLLHACLAQPGEETFRWMSPGRSPIQYIVDRCPTGYDAYVCSTSFGRAVVPEVK